MDVKEMASMGGKARARKLGKKKLVEHAHKMVEARLNKKREDERIYGRQQAER